MKALFQVHYLLPSAFGQGDGSIRSRMQLTRRNLKISLILKLQRQVD